MSIAKVKDLTRRSNDIGNFHTYRTKLDIGNASYSELVKKIRQEIYNTETVSSDALKSGIALLVGGLKGRLTKTLNDSLDRTVAATMPLISQYMILKSKDDILRQLATNLSSNGHSELGDTLLCLGNTIKSMLDELFLLVEVAASTVIMDSHVVNNLADVINGLVEYRGKGLNDKTMQMLEKIGLVSYQDGSVLSADKGGNLDIGTLFAGLAGTGGSDSSDSFGSFRDGISLGGSSLGDLSGGSDIFGGFNGGGSSSGGGLDIFGGSSSSGGGLDIFGGDSSSGGGFDLNSLGGLAGSGDSLSLSGGLDIFGDSSVRKSGGFGELGAGNIFGGFEDNESGSDVYSLI